MIKVNSILRALILFNCIVIFFSCEERSNNYQLEQCNTGTPNGRMQKVDTLDYTKAKEYCFEIIHEKVKNLTSYYLVVNINGTIVFSDTYKPKIVCWFVKKTTLNTFDVLLYNRESGSVFSWGNKDVFDFEDKSFKCYKVKLFSEKNIDHGNGIEMEIN
jgi:hypothetical protein